jgi:RND family efflux transporter MFP subunit
VKLNVAEKDAFKLKAGDRVEVTTEVYPGVTFEGNITSVSAKGDEAHTYPVEVAIPNTREHPLKAGMFGRVSFSSIGASDVLTIPREALVGSIRDPRVFVVDGTVARLRAIVVETAAGGSLGVKEGLAEGERVVVNGQNNLRDSTSVLVVAEGAKP